jgi:hypothetical protein
MFWLEIRQVLLFEQHLSAIQKVRQETEASVARLFSNLLVKVNSKCEENHGVAVVYH